MADDALSGTNTTAFIPAFAARLDSDAAAFPEDAAATVSAPFSFAILTPILIGLSLKEPDGLDSSSLKYRFFNPRSSANLFDFTRLVAPSPILT